MIRLIEAALYLDDVEDSDGGRSYYRLGPWEFSVW